MKAISNTVMAVFVLVQLAVLNYALEELPHNPFMVPIIVLGAVAGLSWTLYQITKEPQ